MDLANLVTSSEDDSDVNESFQYKNSPALSNPAIRLKAFFFMTWKTVHKLSHSVLLSESMELLSVMVQRTAVKRISDFLPGSHYVARDYLTVTRDDFETF